MEEIWKDIDDYFGIYQVSSHGRIKSLGRLVKGPSHIGGELYIKGKLLKQVKRKDGYCGINLHRETVQNNFLVHRIVANAFIPNTENKPEVNHKNGIKTDNRVENLEWVTTSENLIHAHKIGIKHPNKNLLGKKGCEHPTSKIVIKYDLSGNFLEEFQSTHEASRLTGINRGSICQCSRGEYNSAGGYKWKYK